MYHRPFLSLCKFVPYLSLGSSVRLKVLKGTLLLSNGTFILCLILYLVTFPILLEFQFRPIFMKKAVLHLKKRYHFKKQIKVLKIGNTFKKNTHFKKLLSHFKKQVSRFQKPVLEFKTGITFQNYLRRKFYAFCPMKKDEIQNSENMGGLRNVVRYRIKRAI